MGLLESVSVADQTGVRSLLVSIGISIIEIPLPHGLRCARQGDSRT